MASQLFFPITFIVHKRQMGAHGVNGGPCPTPRAPHRYATVMIMMVMMMMVVMMKMILVVVVIQILMMMKMLVFVAGGGTVDNIEHCYYYFFVQVPTRLKNEFSMIKRLRASILENINQNRKRK